MINDKNWQPGDIVYWMHKDGWEPKVHWGRIDEVFIDGLCVDYLEPYERRYVNGVPINEFQSETEYRKLPKNWRTSTSYDDLVNITCSPFPKELAKLRYSEPEDVRKAYEKGLLVKASSIFKGDISTDITKDGYRILKRYPIWYMAGPHRPNTATVRYDEACRTYEEAEGRCSAEIKELKRQASLSDLEWSIEQIDQTLKRWQYIYGKTDEERIAVRNRLLNMNNVEDLEIRLSDGGVQWKYWKKTKWHNIES